MLKATEDVLKAIYSNAIILHIRETVNIPLEEAIRLRNELILNGAWVALTYEGVEITARKYAAVEWNEETCEMHVEASFVPTAPIPDIDGISISTRQGGDYEANVRYDRRVYPNGEIAVRAYLKFSIELEKENE